MNKFILELKSKLNIDLLGVVEVSPLDKVKINMIKDRQDGYFTSFESENFLSRTEPGCHLPGAKSIFVLGMSYYWDSEDTGSYIISRYSRGKDYHLVLKKKLEDLRVELEKHYSFNYYAQVDSGDLYEKDLAVRAGFGYIGKNTLVINEEFGSYIFLGLLVTDIELETYSSEVAGTCGSCKLCQKACPAGAILGDYRMDSSLCHSYLSQAKKETEGTKNISYAFGCDICQLVCPKNANIKKNVNMDFKPRLVNFDQDEIFELSNREFKARYGDYAFSWVGKKTILRNIEIIDKRK